MFLSLSISPNRIRVFYDSETAKKQFLFAQSKIIHYLCSVISPRLGIMSFGWDGCRHNKGVKSALFWFLETSQLSIPYQNIATIDDLGICIFISILTI